MTPELRRLVMHMAKQLPPNAKRKERRALAKQIRKLHKQELKRESQS